MPGFTGIFFVLGHWKNPKTIQSVIDLYIEAELGELALDEVKPLDRLDRLTPHLSLLAATVDTDSLDPVDYPDAERSVEERLGEGQPL